MPITSSPIATSRLKRVILAPLTGPVLLALAVSLLLALAMSTTTAKANGAPATSTTSSMADPGFTRIQARHSAMCLDVRAASPSPGAPLLQWHCGETANQQFSSAAGGGAFNLAPGAAPTSIWVRHSAQVLDNGSSFARSSQIQQWPFHGGTQQQWVFLPAGDNWFLIHNKHSGQCLDIKDGSRRTGARANQFPCHGNANQQFRFLDQ